MFDFVSFEAFHNSDVSFQGPCCLHLQGEVAIFFPLHPLHPEDVSSMDL